MSETPNQTLDRVTDTIAQMVEDLITGTCLAKPDPRLREAWDRQNFETHVRRLLRDECVEMWEVTTNQDAPSPNLLGEALEACRNALTIIEALQEKFGVQCIDATGEGHIGYCAAVGSLREVLAKGGAE